MAMAASPTEAIDPRGVALALHHLPTVQWIAPTVSRLAEKSGRNSGHHLRLKTPIKPEQFTVRPHIGTVVVHKDRNVTGNPNRPLRTIASQRLPLFVEGKLQRTADLEINFQFLADFFQGSRLAMRQVVRPLIPAVQFLLGPHGIEQNKVIQPPGILRLEMIKTLTLAARSRVHKVAPGLEQKRHFVSKNLIVFNRFNGPRICSKFVHLAGLNPAMLDEALKTDEKRIAGERRGCR